MSCVDCGRRCTGRRCRDCERDRYWGGAFGGPDAAGCVPTVADGGETTETDDPWACDRCGVDVGVQEARMGPDQARLCPDCWNGREQGGGRDA